MMNVYDLQNLGKKISFLRKQKSLSQEELSFIAKIARSTLQNIESGKVDPHFSTLVSLANALEVDLIEFFPSNHSLGL